MIEIRKTNKAEIEPYRIAYLSSLPEFQDIFLEFMVNESIDYLLLNGNKTVGYVIVSPEHALVECYMTDEYLAPKDNLFSEILTQLGIRHIYCKSFDHILFNLCVAQNLPHQVVGYLYRDYIEPAIMPSVHLSNRYADQSDLPFLMAQDDEVFEPKNLLETHINNKSIVIFGDEHEIAGCGFFTRVHPAFGYYDLGVWVHPRQRRKGYATAIMQHVKRICMESGGTPICGCDATNTASQQMLHKIGFISNHQVLDFEIGDNKSSEDA